MRTLTEIVEEFERNNDSGLSNDEQRLISEMATIGWFQGRKFKVFVNGNEGRIPHMHIWDDATNGRQFHACVMLEKPAYFKHGRKSPEFSSKELGKFIQFLHSIDEDLGVPIWKVLVRQWNKTNDVQVYMLADMPDYYKLNTNKLR